MARTALSVIPSHDTGGIVDAVVALSFVNLLRMELDTVHVSIGSASFRTTLDDPSVRLTERAFETRALRAVVTQPPLPNDNDHNGMYHGATTQALTILRVVLVQHLNAPQGPPTKSPSRRRCPLSSCLPLEAHNVSTSTDYAER